MKQIITTTGTVVLGLALSALQAQAEKIYRFVNDQVSVEAEALSASAKWQKASSKAGYTGSGYVIYKGPEMAPPGPTEQNWETNPPEQQDITGQYQGSEADWLKIPCYVETAGTYFVNIRNQHDHNCFEPWCYDDGDATVWTHAVGYKLPVRQNFGHSHTANNSWMWMKFGPGLEGSDIPPNAPFQFKNVPQVVTFYVAGRDVNFKADRIHIYRMVGAQKYPANHNNDNAPLSALTDAPSTRTVAAVGANPHAGPAVSGAAFDVTGRAIVRSRGPLVAMVENRHGGISVRIDRR